MTRPRRRLIVMVKLPRPGRVKTRLARDLGRVPAAWWFRHATGALLRRLDDPRWELVLAVTPDAAGMAARCWPAGIRRLPQGGGDLGARMRRLLAAPPATASVLIGADIPAIRRHHIARLFAALGARDAAFGPAGDGGFWAVGLKHPARAPMSFMRGVRWSTRHALSDTLATLGGLTYSLTDVLDDVDTGHDLARLSARTRF